MILKSTLGSDETSASNRTEHDEDEDENVAKKFKPDDDLDDLKSEKQEEVHTLKLVNPERYLRAPTIDRLQKNTVTPMMTNVNAFKQDVSNWNVNTELNLNSTLALRIVKDLTPGGALMHGTTAQTLSQLVPSAIQEEMQTIYVSLSELLRHFWSSFPPSSALIEEKVCSHTIKIR